MWGTSGLYINIVKEQERRENEKRLKNSYEENSDYMFICCIICKFSHSQIVWGYDYDSKTSSDTLKLAQHTYNTRDLIIHDYITTTNYTYVRYYQMIKKK